MSAAPATLQRVARPEARGVLAVVERLSGLTPSGLSLAVGAVACWAIAYVVGSRVLFLMVYGVSLLLVVLSIAGRRKVGVAARRSDLPTRVREGQSVSVELAFEGKGRVGTLVLEEGLGRLGAPVRLLVPTLVRGAPVTHSYSFTPRLRGVYPIGPLVAVVSDPFGLTRKRHILVPPAQIIVHPSTQRVHDRVLAREWEDPPIRPPISKPWPTGFEFYGMREYVAGDDPRRIVWRATARTGKYMVREAEQGITDRVTVILDTDARTHEVGDPSPTFETAVRAVASLARLHLREGSVVSIESPAGPVARALRGQRTIVGMLDAMARVSVGREPLEAVLRRLLGDPRRDSHNILVTPHLEHGAAQLLRLLLDRGGSMTFVHVVTEESDPRSAHRAAALGCEVVELAPGASLDAVFRRGVGAGIRR